MGRAFNLPGDLHDKLKAAPRFLAARLLTSAGLSRSADREVSSTYAPRFTRKIFMSNTCKCLLLALCALFIAGCGPVPPGVHGTVKIKGEPLASGVLRFVPEAGGEEFRTNISNGEFNMAKNDIAGKHKVIVEVMFASSGDASSFYENLEKGNPTGPDPHEKASKTYEFDEEFTNGPNLLEYDIPE